MPFLIRCANKTRGTKISAAPDVLVGGINVRRPAAPKTERRRVKFILWIAARNDRISVANVT